MADVSREINRLIETELSVRARCDYCSDRISDAHATENHRARTKDVATQPVVPVLEKFLATDPVAGHA